MTTDLLTSFREAYGNLRLLPLLGQKELNQFKVDYGLEILEELEQLVEDDPTGDGKIIFTGHRGCGKSTLLAEFSQQMTNRYFVVFFSIADMIEMSDVNHINILFAIAVRLMDEAEKQQIKIQPDTKKRFYDWFATHTRIEKKEWGMNAALGIDLFKLIIGKLQADKTIRDEIKQEFVRKISELIARINEIASVVQTGTKKEIIVIIDGLDKLDLAVAREICQEHIKALFQPHFRIILTIPISALRDVSLAATMETESNNQIVSMKVSKLFKKEEKHLPNATPEAKIMARLLDVLNKRISPELIESQTAENIVIYSGGVLREVIRIANECCSICLRLIRRQPERNDIKINEAILQEAIKNLRIDFDTRIGKADYEILETTYQQFKPNDPQEQRFLDLLHGLYALEYRNDELWYDVHPIVAELLPKKG